MKDIKIEIPEGHEIDKELSTFELIKFKKIENKLPESWEELKEIGGFYVNEDSKPSNALAKTVSNNKNIFPTYSQAQASIALAQLLQLRDVYRDGWVPNFTNDSINNYVLNIKKKQMAN